MKYDSFLTHELNCDEAQMEFKRYLNNEMDLADAYSFVIHIKGCEKCKEELCEYYAFYAALKYLNDSSEDSDIRTGKFAKSIERKMLNTENMYKREKTDRLVRRIVYICVVALLSIAAAIK